MSYFDKNNATKTKDEIWNLIIDYFNCRTDVKGMLFFFIDNPELTMAKSEIYYYIENILINNLRIANRITPEEIMRPIINKDISELRSFHSELLVNIIWFFSPMEQFVRHRAVFEKISVNLQKIILLQGQKLSFDENNRIWRCNGNKGTKKSM